MSRAQEIIELSAGPPPYPLSPMVLPVGCCTAVLPMPTTRGEASPPHQPQAEPPDWPRVNSLKRPSTKPVSASPFLYR